MLAKSTMSRPNWGRGDVLSFRGSLMTYRAPISDMIFAMLHEAGLAQGLAAGLYPELEDVAENVLAPLNRAGDLQGVKLDGDRVQTVAGWPAAYRQWREGGWNAVAAPVDYGGMGLPVLVNAACAEMWNAANMAFALCPMLSGGAIDALAEHGSERLKALFLEKVVTGEWTGTMNLTEPQAGSDLNAVRTRAEPQADGTYKIFGSKIFITYGEHDLTDNIVHLVLARLPDAPPGTRGISLFLVPKFLVEEDGSLGQRNDVHCVGVEHKLGIHASPTCTLAYGDHGGAVGFLIGEENRGLACMFTMMNNARLNVGIQGVAIAERATQQAVAFAHERRQGRALGETAAAMSIIAAHPDVQRMLMTMKALTAAARSLCFLTAAALDAGQRAGSDADRRAGDERASLLTPIAKAFSTDIANEVASLGIQVHGGMGFIEETGAAQYYRDARIAAIYEGTNGIQAVDLVQRKLGLSGGEVLRNEIADMRAVLEDLRSANAESFGHMSERLSDAVDGFERATAYIVEATKTRPSDALAGASPYLRLFAYARGGTALARGALAAHRMACSGGQDRHLLQRIAIARFFAEHVASGSVGLELSIRDGAAAVLAGSMALAG
jgi:acyl-CoA dehydrogenase